ncbi:M1 family metallopeptidase [Austwickia chelonae]|uniref:M1 family metallopeptidase n=1 Tax=Austwickia chelonae TaxID=100225 RepID=UPI000E27ECD7|nr:M1 family metallopeptidase [Austwickia chelonae]
MKATGSQRRGKPKSLATLTALGVVIATAAMAPGSFAAPTPTPTPDTTFSYEQGEGKSTHRVLPRNAGDRKLAGAFSKAAPGIGAPGIGDPYYPEYGNGGYDVKHYDIDVDYTTETGLLKGTTIISAQTTQQLKRFNVDFALDVSKVTVNGQPASFRRTSQREVTITPATSLAKNAEMKVAVTYSGVPSKTKINGSTAWISTDEEALAVGEPEIAPWWFPSNDHPRDKATFDISLTVPEGMQAVSNGRLVNTSYGEGRTTWTWSEDRPMATYLAFMAVGKYEIMRGTSPSGIPWLNAVSTKGTPELKQARQDLQRTPEIVDWLASQFGEYPFTTSGGVAPGLNFGFALETQTRPVYSPTFWDGGDPNLDVIVHELAHQWFGNSISLKNWKDIWINEGFASWAEWRWAELKHNYPPNQIFKQQYEMHPASDAKFWNVVLTDPGPGREFAQAEYVRGSMAVQALRNRVGEATFWAIIRGWTAKYQHGVASVQDFIDFAQEQSGQDLSTFFRAWLMTPGRPAPSAELGFPASMIPKS